MIPYSSIAPCELYFFIANSVNGMDRDVVSEYCIEGEPDSVDNGGRV